MKTINNIDDLSESAIKNFIHLEIGLIKCPKNARKTEKNCNVAQIYIGCFLKFPPQLNVYCRIYKLFVMRYALRKQDKIKAVLGNEYLENNILQSLNKYFENSNNDRIYSDIEPDGYVTDYGNKYPLLRINDVANSDAMLEFAVMGQMYDVLNLSYVGRMKG